MTATKKTRNPRARVALIAALGLLLGGGVGSLALAQSQAKPHRHAETEAQAPYRSSIQVPDDDKEKGESAEEAEGAEKAGEAEEAEGAEEHGDVARYQSLARITADQARSAALAKVPGTALSVELENEDGNLVYGVTVKTTAGERDVKVDAGNGTVLHIEQDEQD